MGYVSSLEGNHLFVCLFVCLFVLELLEMGWRFNTSYCHCKSPTDDKISVEFPGVYSESSKTNGIPRRKNKKTIYRINIWWDAYHQSFWKDWVVSKLPTGRCRKHVKNYGVYVVHESQLLANHLGSNAQVWRSSLPLGLTKQRCRDHWWPSHPDPVRGRVHYKLPAEMVEVIDNDMRLRIACVRHMLLMH